MYFSALEKTRMEPFIGFMHDNKAADIRLTWKNGEPRTPLGLCPSPHQRTESFGILNIFR